MITVLLLAAIALGAIAATIRVTVLDGYRRVPTRHVEDRAGALEQTTLPARLA